MYDAPRDAVIAGFLGDVILLSADICNEIASCLLGDIPVSERAPAGLRQIMLRPEQVRILPPDRCSGERIVMGRVTSVEFNGPLSFVMIELDEDALTKIRIPVFSSDVPVEGTPVCLRVHGMAHVFG